MAEDMSVPISRQCESLGSLIQWVKALRVHYRLKALLRSLVDYHGSSGLCFPSIKRLANELCVSRQTIHRWLNQLEDLSLLKRCRRYRPDGGKTSNLYQFVLHGLVTRVGQQEDPPKNNVKHADKPNAVCETRKPVKEKAPKSYRIDAKQMKSVRYANTQYKTAVDRRWVSSGERDRLSYFSCWSKVVRLFRSGKVKNPGAMLSHILKTGLLHRYPAECDEATAIKALRYLRKIDIDLQT